MRLLIVLLFLLFSPTVNSEGATSDITVLQINTRWNQQNDIDLRGLVGCKVKYGLLEHQKPSFKAKIKYVPVIVIYKGTRPVKQWTADLTFKLDVDLLEIQKEVNKL